MSLNQINKEYIVVISENMYKAVTGNDFKKRSLDQICRKFGMSLDRSLTVFMILKT